MTAPLVRWTADRDGEAHAHSARGRAIRTACGKRAVDERLAWPAQRRCEACTQAVEAATAAAR